MNNLINQLFIRAKSEDQKVSSDAITALCCILEIKSWNLSKNKRYGRYSTYLSADIIELEIIDEQDEIAIIEFLCTEVLKDNQCKSSILFAIGKATCKVALRPLIDKIEKQIDRFSENEVYQAFVSLERLLFFDESLPAKDAKEIIKQTNLIKVISIKILSCKISLHSDLESTSLRLLARLNLLLNGYYD